MKKLKDVVIVSIGSIGFFLTLAQISPVVERNLEWIKTQGIFGLYLIILPAFTVGLFYSLLMTQRVRPRRPWTPKLTWIVLVTSFVIIVLFVFVWVKTDTAPIKILYPQDDDSVGVSESIEGYAGNVPTGKSVWIVIYSHQDRMYYPHDNSATVRIDGYWTSPVTVIGARDDGGKRFDILALFVDQYCKHEFELYLASPIRAGLSKIPTGAEICAKISVVRK